MILDIILIFSTKKIIIIDINNIDKYLFHMILSKTTNSIKQLKEEYHMRMISF